MERTADVQPERLDKGQAGQVHAQRQPLVRVVLHESVAHCRGGGPTGESATESDCVCSGGGGGGDAR